MPELPSGTITFLVSDIEGSTRLLHQHGERFAELLSEHRAVLRDAFERHGDTHEAIRGGRTERAHRRRKQLQRHVVS